MNTLYKPGLLNIHPLKSFFFDGALNIILFIFLQFVVLRCRGIFLYLTPSLALIHLRNHKSQVRIITPALKNSSATPDLKLPLCPNPKFKEAKPVIHRMDCGWITGFVSWDEGNFNSFFYPTKTHSYPISFTLGDRYLGSLCCRY